MSNKLKNVLMALFLMLGINAMAQQKIELHPSISSKCEKSDMTSLTASFSFSTIEAEDYASDRGTFSWLSLPNTVLSGNVGEPQIPVVNELIAVPLGAKPRIEITSYRSTDYNLADYDMKTLVPRQRPVRKSNNPGDEPFVIDDAAYQSTRGLRSEPQASINVDGTMRGIQIGTMTIEPVSYDPVNNRIRVFNDIEVTVHFDGADVKATEEMLLKTYSPAFEPVYGQLFNDRAVKDAYSNHPDLYNTPVRMLVICSSDFQNNAALNSWLEWKLQKGYYVDIFYTNETGTTASAIASFIKTKYNASAAAGNAYTYLIVIGDTGQVPYYMVKYIDSDIKYCASDLGYSSVNFSSNTNNYFPDMFYSRISVENTTQLTNYVDKVLTYEKFEFADGGDYLNNVVLVGGWDSNWTPRVAKPTINYATDNYFNSSNTTYGGFGSGTIHATISTSSTQGWSGTNHGCYDGLNDGVCFLNYTAHGDKQEWQGPQFTAKAAEGVTNTGKYFFGIGNCCLTGNYNLDDANYSPSYAPSSSIGATASFGETMIRVPNAGAVAYVGCSPYSYWFEDFYWAVGAHSYSQGNAPTVSASSTGVYDAMFNDQNWNSASALMYLGNLAVQQAVTNSNTNSDISGSGEGGDCNNSAHYYFQFYHTFGDGSIMPYITKPETNTVSHANTIIIGATTFTVSADAGSYVAITKDNTILGVAEVPSSGSVNVPISGLNSGGDVKIVVTRQQRQPYITTIQAISTSGPYISLDSYTPNIALIGETTDLSMTFKNVGSSATSGNTTVTLSSNDSNVTVDTPTQTFGSLAANATTTVSGFQFHFNTGATVGSNYTIHYTATNGSNTWGGDITVTANQVYTVTVGSNNNDYGTVTGGGQYDYDASCTLTATPADGYMFTNWTQNGNVVSTDAEYTFTVSSDVNLVANFAAGVMIGDGSSSKSEYLPTYNYYNYSLTEQIYTSAELGGAGAITSIAFYNEGAEKTRTLDFYLKATTKNTFSSKTDWITVSSSDKVFSGSVTMVANDWTTITFSSPFVYDGTSNVVLVVDDNTGEYTNSPHMACRVFNANGNQAIYTYDDNTNFNPLSPSSGSYNNLLSVKNQIILTKEAISTEPVNITVSANPAQAGTVSGGGEYTYGQTCTVTVTPNTGYTFTGWTENGTVVSSELSFSFSAVSDRNLVANFIHAIEIGQATTTHNYLPTYNYYNYSMTEQIYTADEIGTAGTITSIAFYNEGAEKTRTLDLYLKATDKEAFSSKTDWVTVAASDKVFSGEVTMLANNWTFITFNTPYEYDGTSNLVLVTDDNSGAYTSSPHMACSVYNTNSTQAIYIYSDGTNYNPSSPTTSQSSNYATLSVKNHILLAIESTSSDCIRPTGLTVTEIGQDFVKLSWTENGTSEEWVVACGDQNFTANTNENFVIDGLTPGTNYTIKVRPACSENLWSSEITVTTLSSCPVPTDLSVSGITHNSAVVSWNGYNDNYELQYAKIDQQKDVEELTYDFEDGTYQGWTLLKGNTGDSPNNWMHVTEYTQRDYTSGYGHEASDGWMISESYISAAASGSGTAVTPDNYLVSPQVELGGSISFWATDGNDEYGEEHFSVCVSTNGNTDISDFTQVQEWTLLQARKTRETRTFTDHEWYQYTVDLSGFSGLGYIAIRHFGCYDQWMLGIDDVTIIPGQAPWTTISNATSPFTLTDLDSKALYVARVKALNGNEESDWSEEVEFTTLGLLELADDDSGADVQNNSDLISENADVETDVELVGRTLYKDGAWNTLCLPFNMTAAQVTAQLAPAPGDLKELDTTTPNEGHVTGVEGSTLYLNFKNAENGISAGVPYLIKWTNGAPIVNPTFSGVKIVNGDPTEVQSTDQKVSFKGSYTHVTLKKDNESILFVGVDESNKSTLYWPSEDVGLNSFRAYFQLADPTAVRSFSLNFGDNSKSNGIMTMSYTKKAEGWYTLDGRKLLNAPKRKGLYIHNGVKVTIK